MMSKTTLSLNCCSIISAKLVVHLICMSSCNSLFFGRFACDKPCSYDEGGPQTIEIFGKMSMIIRIVVICSRRSSSNPLLFNF